MMVKAIRYNMVILFLMLATLFVGYMVSQPKVIIDRNYTQSIKVIKGDTLWTIAERVATPDVDIREVIYTMKEMNQLSGNELTPGIVLKVPTVRIEKSSGSSLLFSSL